MNEHTNDTMPRETALSYLTDPKARLTAPFRKQLKAALERPMPSHRTILRGSEGYLYASQVPMTPLDRMLKTCRDMSVTLAQLIKWGRRASVKSRHFAWRSLKAKSDADKSAFQGHALELAGAAALYKAHIDARTAPKE